MKANKALTPALLWAGFAGAALAESCGPQAWGVSREIRVGGAPQIGLKSYPQTLDLADREIVLTFDDGPAATTPRVLAALAAECAKATFFLIGRNAAERPDLVRKEIEAGHTVGSHSQNHPLRTLRALPYDKGLAEIELGAAAVDKASGGKASKFFRFPGFGDTPELLAALERKDMPTFGADVWASDWIAMTPQAEVDLLMTRLRHAGRGIVLLHDIKKQTADMLPLLIARLKAENFKLVHVVAGESPPALRKAPAGWTSETDAALRHMGIGARARPPMTAPETQNAPDKAGAISSDVH
jgi:peptidoglycan-N-acetylglucosamine deacetylase